jgi:hypothetical protein
MCASGLSDYVRGTAVEFNINVELGIHTDFRVTYDFGVPQHTFVEVLSQKRIERFTSFQPSIRRSSWQ